MRNAKWRLKDYAYDWNQALLRHFGKVVRDGPLLMAKGVSEHQENINLRDEQPNAQLGGIGMGAGRRCSQFPTRRNRNVVQCVAASSGTAFSGEISNHAQHMAPTIAMSAGQRIDGRRIQQ